MNIFENLEDLLFENEASTLLVYFGYDDEGERYIDIEVVKGHCQYNTNEYNSQVDCIGATDLEEAIRWIIQRLERDK